jgi:transcriptional regulator with XRE-family HTH domain
MKMHRKPEKEAIQGETSKVRPDGDAEGMIGGARDVSGNALNERLRVARKLAGLSQGQIARLMGLHRPTVSEIEAGRRRVAAEELKSFAQHYGVTEAWLLGTSQTDASNSRVQLAARELEKLKPDDIKRVLDLLLAIGATSEATHDKR